jgi:hypothetical protein
MSHLIYAGIVLEGIKTRRFEITPIYDDSGIDLLYQKIQIEVQCIFNPAATSYPSSGQLPGITVQAVKQILMTPRNQLVFDNGVNVITSPQAFVPIDIDWGPFPDFCNIEVINGVSTWIVSYGVTTFANDCLRVGLPVLSNRWGQEWSVDQNMRTHITTTGKCVLAADTLALSALNPHTLVNAIVPYVLPYFRRERLTIGLDPQGTSIVYSCEDIETYYSLGTLADPNSVASKYSVTSFEVGYTQQTAQKNDSGLALPVIRCTLDGVVYGHTFAGKGQLVAFVLDLVIEKLYNNAIQVGGQPPLMCDFNIRQSLNSPEVHFSVSTFNLPGPQAPAPLTNVLFIEPIQMIPDSGTNPQLHWGGVIQYKNPTYTAYLQSLLAACVIPCNLAIPYGAFQTTTMCGGPAAYSYITTVPTKVFTPTSYNQPYPSYYNPNNNYMYGEYDIRVKYESHYNIIAAPTTAPSSLSPYTVNTIPVSKGSINSDNSAAVPYWSDQQYNNRNPSAIMAVGNPTSTMTFTWSGTRAGAPPLIPHPKIDASSAVLVHSIVEPAAPQLAPDGNILLWSVSGEYTYALPIPIIPGDNLYTGICPYLVLNFNTTTIPAASFCVGGIIDDGGGNYQQNS